MGNCGEKWRDCLIRIFKPMTPETPDRPFFSGTFERTLDAKNRVAVPAAWVSGEDVEFFVVPHPVDGQLMVMPQAELRATEQQIKDSSIAPHEKRMAIRQFLGAAHRVLTDKQGRILIPDTHAASAGISGEIVFVGAGGRFEIWSKDRHAANQPATLEAYKRVTFEIGL